MCSAHQGMSFPAEWSERREKREGKGTQVAAHTKRRRESVSIDIFHFTTSWVPVPSQKTHSASCSAGDDSVFYGNAYAIAFPVVLCSWHRTISKWRGRWLTTPP